MTKQTVADQDERTRAIHERERNVIVDAGAGTGKTTLLVARLVQMIAPDDDGPCLELDRVAAITFTRKAAGELKLRLRQALLEHGARKNLSKVRARRLAVAMESLDNAAIGTVHGFADRLLRLRPADARISPNYDIAEDSDALMAETFEWLLEAAKQGTLVRHFEGTRLATCAMEAADTIFAYESAGMLTRTEEYETHVKLGLDWFVRDMINTRDRDLIVASPADPDLSPVRAIVDELGRLVSDLTGQTPGTRRLKQLYKIAQRIGQSDDTAGMLRAARSWVMEIRRTKPTKRDDFDGDEAGWQAWKWIKEGVRGAGKKKEERPGGPLHEDLVEPLMAWMSLRLMRAREIVLARYREVKQARQVLDQVDLLIALRDVLRDNREARAFYQARFDHILVDEFQDTDPLQAEILMFLCEQGTQATNLAEVVVTPGKLTIVGDPKQSIYRFRRADIAMYAQVCAQVRLTPVCESRLTVNFRSDPRILGFVNEGFDAVLGAEADGPPFDPETGSVRNVRLSAGRARREEASVHVLPFGDASLLVDESRDLEGQALARYLRWLVEKSDVQVTCPHTNVRRRARYGDVAVLVVSTQTVHHLLGELDAVGVPHVVRGGTLFMQDGLHRHFMLGLRALSDTSDGVAQAALLRPPFFAVGLDDLVRDKLRGEGSAPPALEEARAIIQELRRERHQRSPGETARALLERSGFGTFVAAGPNGEQRLARLYELCLALDTHSREQGVDYDAVSALARQWVDAPCRLEAPLPIDADAVQVITVHQAKGLEWPIVALWDGRASWQAFLPTPALSVDVQSGEWAIALDGLKYDPTGKELRERELSLLKEERKRVAYVAATRARDVLVVPEAGEPNAKTIAGSLLLSSTEDAKHRVGAYLGGGRPWWELPASSRERSIAPPVSDVNAAWSQASQIALAPRLAPMGVSAAAHLFRAETPEQEPRRERKGRHGPAFGTTVHRALELLLTGAAGDPRTVVLKAAREVGLRDHLDTAEADVVRAVTALEQSGLRQGTLHLEYPLAGAIDDTTLLVGSIDLLVEHGNELVIIDFKTDQPPSGNVHHAYPAYVAQAASYAALLQRAGAVGSRQMRTALLFTADGGLRWL